MPSRLQERLKQSKGFSSLAEEALLGLIVAAADVEAQIGRVCRAYGLGTSHYNVLRILRGAPAHGYARNEIIDRMLDPSPDVTRLIDALSNKGLVARERCAEDRRKMMHSITAKGRALLDEMAEAVRGVHACFAEQFDEKELRDLIRLSEKIYGRRPVAGDETL